MLNYVDTKFNNPVTVTQSTSTPPTSKVKSEQAVMLRFQYDF